MSAGAGAAGKSQILAEMTPNERFFLGFYQPEFYSLVKALAD